MLGELVSGSRGGGVVETSIRSLFLPAEEQKKQVRGFVVLRNTQELPRVHPVRLYLSAGS